MCRAASSGGKGHLEQHGIHHRPIEVPAGEFVGLQREGPQPYGDHERARGGEGRGDPQVEGAPKPVVEFRCSALGLAFPLLSQR